MSAIWGVCLASEFLIISSDCWSASSVSSWTTSNGLLDCCCTSSIASWTLSEVSLTVASADLRWQLIKSYVTYDMSYTK